MSSNLRQIATKITAKHRELLTVRNIRKLCNSSNILTSVYKKLTPLNCSVNEFLWLNLDRWPDKTATECGLTGRGYTYAQTHRMSMTFAASLRSKLKLQTDDTVAIILPNVPEYPTIMLGILQAGCVATTVNPTYKSSEMKRQFEMLNCKAIAASQLSYPVIMEALKAMKRDIPVILIENEGLPEKTIKFSDLAEDFSIDTSCLKSIKRASNDVAVIPFSSGTTGLPKGVVLTHGNVVAVNQMIADPEIVAIEETTATYQAVMPAVLPFFHIFGMSILMLNQMHLGCKLVTMPSFKPEVFLKVLMVHKPSAVFVVPPMAVFMGKHPAVSEQHLSSLTSVVCGAAPLSETDAEAIIKKNRNLIVRQGFGLTETTGALCIGGNKDRNLASVGHVLADTEVIIADINTGEALGPGEEGEICVRGPAVMRGYYNDERANSEVFTGRWFKTGDVGRYDDDNYLYVTDRLKELIKVKGFQVAPAELEALLRTHPKILDCAVIGVPDDISGEVPKAFIVPQQGQRPTEEEIKQHVNAKVTSYKNIDSVQIVESIPKNAAGKILRKDLKKLYC